jgi:hypothetical protein
LPAQQLPLGVVVGFAVDTLGLGEGAVGLFLGAIGVGGILAFPAAIAVVGGSRLYRSLGLGLVLWGLPLALAALVPNPAAALVLFGRTVTATDACAPSGRWVLASGRSGGGRPNMSGRRPFRGADEV